MIWAYTCLEVLQKCCHLPAHFVLAEGGKYAKQLRSHKDEKQQVSKPPLETFSLGGSPHLRAGVHFTPGAQVCLSVIAAARSWALAAGHGCEDAFKNSVTLAGIRTGKEYCSNSCKGQKEFQKAIIWAERQEVLMSRKLGKCCLVEFHLLSTAKCFARDNVGLVTRAYGI